MIQKITLLFVFSTLLFACSRTDDTPPYVRLIGAADTSIVLNQNFNDPLIYAKDNDDGILQPVIGGNFNKDSIGVYTITYTATDLSGNSSVLTRTVTVGNEASKYSGSYSITGMCQLGSLPSMDNIRPSNISNNSLVIPNFSCYTNSNITVNVGEDGSLQIPWQERMVNIIPIVKRFFNGEGNKTDTTFNFNYIIVEVDTGGREVYNSCSATYLRK